MVNKKILLLAPGVVLGAMVMAAETPQTTAAATVNAAGMTQAELLENVGRQAKLFDSTVKVNQANNLMLNARYQEAIDIYNEVVKDLEADEGGDKFKEKTDFCRKRIAECYYNMAEEAIRLADELATSHDFEEAIKRCEIALEQCPERKVELEERIVFYKKRRDAAANRESVEINKLNPDFAAQEYQMQLLLEQGIVLVKRGELMKAKRKFEEVLLIDPYNEAAVQNIWGINTRIRDAANGRAEATARHMTGEVEWYAAIPIVASSPAGTGENQIVAPVDKEESGELEKRLKEIMIPNFVLYDKLQTFAEAVDDLRNQTLENDPQRRGINFVIRDAKYTDPNNIPKLAGYSPGKSSLYDILVELQERGDLKFKLDDNAVVIVAKGVKLEKMTTKVFSFGMSPGETAETLKEALKAGAQVTFDEGSSITLVPVRSEVISRNTPSNQRLIESWLATHGDKGAAMVQIMFKFLEVAQNDLDELGFNWTYSRTGNHISFDVGNNALLRHYSNEDANDRYGGASAPGGTEDATYNFNWKDSKNNLTASLYALDWADSSDILYSPRVTTLNGTTAVVNMTEKHNYPGDYEDIDNESTEKARVYVTMPQPALDDEKELGIKFRITPNVQDDLIQTKVNFTIQQFDSWLIVDSRNLENEDDDGEYTKKAVINTRSINTDVTLKDGQTVLIGSIAQDLTTVLNDKIPILGDIPFIGRFFQSKYTVSKKNNLLVFMTCKLINPDGSALYKNASGGPLNNGGQQGLPQFPRNQ